MFTLRAGLLSSAALAAVLAFAPAALADDEAAGVLFSERLVEVQEVDGLVALSDSEMSDLRGLGFLDDLVDTIVDVVDEDNTGVVQVGGTTADEIEDAANDNTEIFTIGGVTTIEQSDLPITINFSDGLTTIDLSATTQGLPPGVSIAPIESVTSSVRFSDVTRSSSTSLGF